jgi:hypothetical protein
MIKAAPRTLWRVTKSSTPDPDPAWTDRAELRGAAANAVRSEMLLCGTARGMMVAEKSDATNKEERRDEISGTA